jgi:hypothetical protein
MNTCSRILLALAVLGFAGTASAQNVGLGWENGVSLRASAGSVFLQGIMSFTTTSFESDAGDINTFDIAGYVMVPVSTLNRADLSAFGGVGIGTRTDFDTDIAIRGGIEPGIRVTEAVGLDAKAGLELLFAGGREEARDSGATRFGVFGQVGVHWYF